MKQTAVEWLKKELEDYGSNSHLSLDWNTFDELCEQAKELDKEQSIQYAKEYAKQMLENKRFVTAEMVYNETYKQD
jgi:hypothetical protein